MKKTSFLQEEKRSTILFLWLFYIVFFVYDILYYDLFPAFPWHDVNDKSMIWYNFMYVKYGVILGLYLYLYI